MHSHADDRRAGVPESNATATGSRKSAVPTIEFLLDLSYLLYCEKFAH